MQFIKDGGWPKKPPGGFRKKKHIGCVKDPKQLRVQVRGGVCDLGSVVMAV